VGCSLHLLQDSQLQAACVANLGPSLEAGTRGHWHQWPGQSERQRNTSSWQTNKGLMF
jgi:hypothetical protein